MLSLHSRVSKAINFPKTLGSSDSYGPSRRTILGSHCQSPFLDTLLQ